MFNFKEKITLSHLLKCSIPLNIELLFILSSLFKSNILRYLYLLFTPHLYITENNSKHTLILAKKIDKMYKILSFLSFCIICNLLN